MDLVSTLNSRDTIESRKLSSEVINVSVMPGRTQQKNSELKYVTKSCLKNGDLMIHLPLMKASIVPQTKICKEESGEQK